MTKAEKFVNDFMQAFDENGLAAPEKIMYLRAYQEIEELKLLKSKSLAIPPGMVCKGSWKLGNNCKKCKKCLDTKIFR